MEKPDTDDFVIQVDDYGQFWDDSVPERALKRINELTKTTNVIVMIFIHGWHHDADPDNENLRDFFLTVADTRKTLIDSSNPNSAVYRLSRKNLTGNESLSIVSIYVGWRGRSLPWILDYATFWNRKAAAERVGEGDLREFLGQLNLLYREKRKLRETGVTRNFFGLTSFGHSFGGQVLFRSVLYEIENELLIKAANIQKSRNQSTQVTDLLGFGDLVVLVNPAFEALQFERIRRLSATLQFGPQQNPIMLVLSSAGDFPRQRLFPIGRKLNALFFKPDFRLKQRTLWTEALGEYEGSRTHSIDLSSSIQSFDPTIYTDNPCAIINRDLTHLPSVGGVSLIPINQHRMNNPFLIAHASTDVVIDHSKIFEETLRKFLNDYIAIIQGKRMLTTNSSSDCK